VAALKTSTESPRGLVPETQHKRIKELLRTIAPENKTLAVIRAAARGKGKDKLSAREIDREIQIHRSGCSARVRG
jgi:hypothetical protein